jgi:hypothetical protein
VVGAAETSARGDESAETRDLHLVVPRAPRREERVQRVGDAHDPARLRVQLGRQAPRQRVRLGQRAQVRRQGERASRVAHVVFASRERVEKIVVGIRRRVVGKKRVRDSFVHPCREKVRRSVAVSRLRLVESFVSSSRSFRVLVATDKRAHLRGGG